MLKTEPQAMKGSTDLQHDNFARQLSAFEKLLVISHSRLSVASLYKNLKVSEYTITHHNPRDSFRITFGAWSQYVVSVSMLGRSKNTTVYCQQ